ncbi:MAG: HEAT repeat domain-containing protein [Deltaproteobacteria bacterium]|nr:HEAT repeat domain-containing protein [Deltaproteobacteria bacterium]
MNVRVVLRFSIALLLLVGVVGACDCGGEPLVVRRVLVDVDPAAEVDREQVRVTIFEVLGNTRGLSIDETRADGAILRVRIVSFARASTADAELVPAGHPPVAPPPATLSLAVDVTEGGRPTLRGHSVASVHGVIDPRALVEQALKDALRQAMQTRAADKLGSDELLAWLDDPSTSAAQQKRAMQALGSRREKRATPLLTALLKSEDPELAGAALQALTLLGDEAGVDAVIAYSERQSPALRKLCIDAVKATGSSRARAWLFTLSSGHPDVAVQAHARAALVALDAAAAPRVAESIAR